MAVLGKLPAFSHSHTHIHLHCSAAHAKRPLVYPLESSLLNLNLVFYLSSIRDRMISRLLFPQMGWASCIFFWVRCSACS